jgi:hypothetical protein
MNVRRNILGRLLRVSFTGNIMPEKSGSRALCRGSRAALPEDRLAVKAGVISADHDVMLAAIQRPLRHARPSPTSHYIHRICTAQMATEEKFLAAVEVTPRPN